ncbi:MAG TPA: glycosyltransferase family A protein [Candidatus Saccharimonadales bacterium]|nr:glycosyltransferase family A protein [Candidatus Saccharimonadales bacterium]
MTLAKRISIIIPAYNEERYLGRCLDSIAAQTVKPYEVIVVDNNSTDKTVEVAQSYSFVRVLHETKQGRAHAQAAGFNAAHGELLARTDADAVFAPDWTTRVAAYFEKPGAMQTAWTGTALFYNVRFPRLVGAIYAWVGFQCNQLLVGHASLWGSSMVVPRQEWLRVRDQLCDRADLHEDLDLSIHLHRQSCTIVYDTHTKVRVELRPAYVGPRKLWEYLQMWPRTLQVHGLRTWVIPWAANLLLFAVTPFFGITERIARLFGRRPLNT